MNKLILSVVFLFVGFTIMSSFMEGAGGIVSTYLSGDITSTVTTVPVASTSGFLAADHVVIGDEQIAYAGVTAVSFTGCTRGYQGTEAVVHSQDDKVYSPETSVVNNVLGFNVASTAATSGAFSVVMIPFKFFTTSLPRIIMFDYSFFSGQMRYVQIFFQVIGLAFALTMAFWVINAAMGILKP